MNYQKIVMEVNLAPVVLFVYNRPLHTTQTLSALSSNYLAQSSHLVIYSDGSKANASMEDLNNIREVRKIIRTKKWCGKVEIIERDKNSGLANSIIIGVTDIVNRYGKVIVLEDDIITSPFFLTYMNEALYFYNDMEKVKCISGYMYPVKEKLSDTFFLKFDSCWGWGTWLRAWNEFNPDSEKLFSQIYTRRKTDEFNFENSFDFYAMLRANCEKKIDSWSIRWYASIFLAEGLTLFPSISYTNNIGNDSSGVHSGKSDHFLVKNLNHSDFFSFEKNIQENSFARKVLSEYFSIFGIRKVSLLDKVKYKINGLLKKIFNS